MNTKRGRELVRLHEKNRLGFVRGRMARNEFITRFQRMLGRGIIKAGGRGEVRAVFRDPEGAPEDDRLKERKSGLGD